MKKMDFQGVYIIHNKKIGKYYYGISGKVFHKVFRIFNGSEGDKIFSQAEDIRSFYLRLIDIDRTTFDNIDKLKNFIEENYDGTLDSIRNIFCTNENERKNCFLLKDEKKHLHRIYKIEGVEERFYGKSDYAGTNKKIKKIKLYNDNDCEIALIKRVQFRAPWDKNTYRDIKILLEGESDIRITNKRNGFKREETILPQGFRIKKNIIGSHIHVVDSNENVLISIIKRISEAEVEYIAPEYKLLALCVALSTYIDRED